MGGIRGKRSKRKTVIHPDSLFQKSSHLGLRKVRAIIKGGDREEGDRRLIISPSFRLLSCGREKHQQATVTAAMEREKIRRGEREKPEGFGPGGG